MTEFVVETHRLRKRFGDKLAVADLSLSVRRGEVFGFLGPNGAGKTTSLKMLLGLIERSGGDGRVLGAPLGDRATRARVGFLPEHFRFQDWLTGRELLRFHGRLFGMRGAPLERRIEELLERVDLVDAAHRPIATYSKGMTQRAGLAQALLNRPDLVFLDEPTSGLDPLGRLLVRDVIRDLRSQGTAVFLNSHLLGEVEATCDRVVFLKQGRTVHELAMAGEEPGLDVEVRLAAAGPEVLAGLSRFGRLDPAWSPGHSGAGGLSAGGAGGPSPAAPSGPVTVLSPVAVAGARPGTPPGTLLRMRVASEDVVPELARWLAGRADLYELRLTRKSLEAWFLEIMGEDQRPG